MPIVLLSLLGLAVFVFRRFEGIGTLLILLAAMMCIWLLGGVVLAIEYPVFVRVLGMHSVTLAIVIALVGSAIRFNWPDRKRTGLVVLPRLAAPSLLITAAPLSLLRPDWRLGNTSLAEVTAGGDLGAFLSGNWLGLAAWLAMLLGLTWIAYPHGPAGLAGLAVRSLRTIRRGVAKAVEIACPVVPAPDELPDFEGFPGALVDSSEGNSGGRAL